MGMCPRSQKSEFKVFGLMPSAYVLKPQSRALASLSGGGQHRLRPDNAFVANFAGDGEAQRDSGDKVPKSQGA